MGHQEARLALRGRGQLVAAVLVVAAVAAAALGLQEEVGTRVLAGAAPPPAPSGAWFCPHGGGREWKTTIEVANPGADPVRLRVTRMSDSRPASPRSYTVEPGSELAIPAATPSRAASTLIEYFGGWVAAGWVSDAGGDEGGVAAEPCASTAGSTWLLPDGSTQLEEASAGPRRQQNAWVVVMNPFATDAIFSLTLYTNDAPVRFGGWTNVVLKPFRSVAFYLNDQRLGYATVSTAVDARVGRVVAATLDVSDLGGARSAIGQLAPVPSQAVLPGGAAQERTELATMNTAGEQTQLTGTVLGRAEPRPALGTDQGQTNAESAQAFALTTDPPSAIDLHVPRGTAVVRRTFGEVSDQAATPPGVPGSAWVVLPAVAGSPSHPGIVLANPGRRAAEVTLSYLPSGSGAQAPAPMTISVPALRTVAVPSAFVQALPSSAVLAIASEGTFVPAASSYSLGREGYAGYAVALGVPIPAPWVPSAP